MIAIPCWLHEFRCEQLFNITFYELSIIQTGRRHLSRNIETLQEFKQMIAMMEKINYTVKFGKSMKAFSGMYWNPLCIRDMLFVDSKTVKPRSIMSLVGTCTRSAYPSWKASTNPKINVVANPMSHPVRHGSDKPAKNEINARILSIELHYILDISSWNTSRDSLFNVPSGFACCLTQWDLVVPEKSLCELVWEH